MSIIPVIEFTSYVIQSLKDSDDLKLRIMGLTQGHLASYPGQVASYPLFLMKGCGLGTTLWLEGMRDIT